MCAVIYYKYLLHFNWLIKISVNVITVTQVVVCFHLRQFCVFDKKKKKPLDLYNYGATIAQYMENSTESCCCMRK